LKAAFVFLHRNVGYVPILLKKSVLGIGRSKDCLSPEVAAAAGGV